MEQIVIASVKFIGSNGKSVTIPNIRVRVGPGPEDCDPIISHLMAAVVVNLLEKKGDGYEAKKEAHRQKYGYDPKNQAFHTVEIEDILVSKYGWRSMVHPGLMDDYVHGVVG